MPVGLRQDKQNNTNIQHCKTGAYNTVQHNKTGALPKIRWLVKYRATRSSIMSPPRVHVSLAIGRNPALDEESGYPHAPHRSVHIMRSPREPSTWIYLEKHVFNKHRAFTHITNTNPSPMLGNETFRGQGPVGGSGSRWGVWGSWMMHQMLCPVSRTPRSQPPRGRLTECKNKFCPLRSKQNTTYS